AAGIIDSKFGAVTLLRLSGDTDGNHSCLGFLKRLDQPNLRLSGWSCQGDTLPARRTAIACTLNRLMLLTAGNDPKLAELFAHAELRASDCAVASAPALSADWVTASDNPRLRGAFCSPILSQAAGFHVTFKILPDYSRPVWPNCPSDPIPPPARMAAN